MRWEASSLLCQHSFRTAPYQKPFSCIASDTCKPQQAAPKQSWWTGAGQLCDLPRKSCSSFLNLPLEAWGCWLCRYCGLKFICFQGRLAWLLFGSAAMWMFCRIGFLFFFIVHCGTWNQALKGLWKWVMLSKFCPNDRCCCICNT